MRRCQLKAGGFLIKKNIMQFRETNNGGEQILDGERRWKNKSKRMPALSDFTVNNWQHGKDPAFNPTVGGGLMITRTNVLVKG